MTFIDWSDPEGMIGLLSEYVADERSESADDRVRYAFLDGLFLELAELTDTVSARSIDESIDTLRAMSQSHHDFAGDPVLVHLEACIEELERISRSQSI